MNKKFILITVCALLAWQKTNAQYPTTATSDDTVEKRIARHTVINGTVLDEKTRQPIPSATVRIENSNKGTIAGKDGTFRLPKGNFTNQSNIRITAVGYNAKTVTLDLTKDTVEILLQQNPVMMREAVVIGAIDANEIIRRAIRKKDENRKKYNTMQGLLYSKFTMDLSKMTNILFNFTGEDNVQVGVKTSSQASCSKSECECKKCKARSQAQFMQGIIAETFSQKYIDVEKELDRTIIVNRRQTANFPSSVNKIVLENFVDFSQDELDFIDVKIITPLHKNALSHYKFELLERTMFEDKYVYVLEVIPNTRVYPTFQGTISILEGTYQLIAVHLKPSQNTKIHLIENLEYYQKFEDVGDDIWFPTYMENRASVKVKLMPFMPPLEAEWTTTAIFSDVIVNQPLPESAYYDSIFYDEDSNITRKVSSTKRDSKGNVMPTTTVLHNADSAKREYWEDNALIALTIKEQEMYAKIDTAAKELKIDIDSVYDAALNAQPAKKKFSWNYDFAARCNRVEGYAFGIAPTVNLPYTKLSGEGLYSLGQKDWNGSAKIEFGTKFETINIFGPSPDDYSIKPHFSVGAEMFSHVNTFGNSFVNNADLQSLHLLDFIFFRKDYFDYFKSDGWNTQLKFGYKKFNFSAMYENRREFGLDKSTHKIFWSKQDFSDMRKNPHPETGGFQLIKLSSVFGGNITSLFEMFQYRFDLNYQYGIRASARHTALDAVSPVGKSFSQISGSASLQFPIFQTGYGNILLLLSASGGLAEHHSPVQHLFIVKESSFLSNLLMPADNTFITAYESYFGGTEFFSYHARLNLRDWWWRLLHLPRIKGRGLELSIAGTTGKFFNKGNTELSHLYRGTVKDYYSEAGIRIGRIPIPGTDLFYWSLECRFGIGEHARGRYGFLLNFNLPFGF